MLSAGKQVKRRLIFISILVFLVVLPAAVMGYIAYSSLEEIKFKSDFYYERVAFDISLRMMHTLEAPLYEPGLLLLREYLDGHDMTDPDKIVPLITDIEANTPYATGFVFIAGPVISDYARVFATETAWKRMPEDSQTRGARQVAEGIFEEVEMFGTIPRGFFTENFGAEIVGISAGLHDERPYIS